jgi:thioredoxin reductase (NADPH)
MSKSPNVPIIGGGPAGMSCALWLANYGLRPVIVERETALGGMARLSPYPNDWLLGRPGESARENAAAFADHIERAAVETWLGGRPEQLRRERDGSFRLDVASAGGREAQSLPCPAIVIATGTSFRGEDWLDQVRNARRLAAQGRVHLGPSWVGEPGGDPGSHVAVIGGGDNAFDVSRMLAEKGLRATVIMRSRSPTARPRLVDELREHEAAGTARVMVARTVTALEEAGSRVRLRLNGGGEIEVDHVVLLFGYRPNASEPWLAGLALEKDRNGYLVVDGNMETSCRGVFAVGDVANPAHPCIATAIGSATMAAREIQRRYADGIAAKS